MLYFDDEFWSGERTDVMSRHPFQDSAAPIDGRALLRAARERAGEAEEEEGGETPTLKLPSSRVMRAAPRRPPPLPFPPEADYADERLLQTPSIAPLSLDLRIPSKTLELAALDALAADALVADDVVEIPPAPPVRRSRKSGVVSALVGGAGLLLSGAIAFVGAGLVADHLERREAHASAAAAAAEPPLVDDLPANPANPTSSPSPAAKVLSPHALPDAPTGRTAAPAARSVRHAAGTDELPSSSEAVVDSAKEAPAVGFIQVPATLESVMVDGSMEPVEYGRVSVACGKPHKVTTPATTQVVEVPCGATVSVP